MAARFEELDGRSTPMGDLSLRRRRDPLLGVDVYEVLLGEEYLMSSLFTVAEVALADLGLAALPSAPQADLDVVVGGLGLGWTARAALADPRVRSLAVVEALGDVVEWHQRGLLPHAEELNDDPRCRYVIGDFFALVAAGRGFGDGVPRPCSAVLLDIDHTPRHVLAPGHAGFYTMDGLARLADLLHPGGVFALWSDDPPDEEFLAVLAEVFVSVQAHIVRFDNPLLEEGGSSNTVYVARRAGG